MSFTVASDQKGGKCSVRIGVPLYPTDLDTTTPAVLALQVEDSASMPRCSFGLQALQESGQRSAANDQTAGYLHVKLDCRLTGCSRVSQQQQQGPLVAVLSSSPCIWAPGIMGT
ncbi:hypothetical protein WJX72_007047 [[Myrmecia] bisecta]|uniref:Uncharacterized protein n=1 Tax=[Myrmecia] bisecta TaxID=41462 RepID=A0AAW1QAP1_9CHLO